MAQTNYAAGDPLAVKTWSKKLAVQAIQQTWFNRFISDDGNSIIQQKDNVEKGAGDKVTYGLRILLTGTGIQGDGTLEGNEEALTTYSDAVLVDQLRHAVNVGGRVSQQRVPFELREEARRGLQDWMAARFDTCFFNQLCGNTVQTDTRYTGNNATVAPTANYTIFPTGISAESSLGSTNTMVISMLDFGVERAIIGPSGNYLIRPIDVDGSQKWVAFLHPSQITDMRQSTATGQWLDISKQAMTGGEVSDNPIYTGALGEYNQVVIHRAARVPQCINAGAFIASTRRGAFCGAQAGVIAFGRGEGAEQFTWDEEVFDYKNILGVAAGTIFGIKKAVFNSVDFAVMPISTYAASH